MPRLLPAALLLLTACAPGLPPEPQAARLFADRLELQMSDGRACRVHRAEAGFDGPRGWGGPVPGCPGVARVEVALEPANPIGRALDGLFAALTLGDLIAPRAEVRVVGDGGRVFLFASPTPLEPRG